MIIRIQSSMGIQLSSFQSSVGIQLSTLSQVWALSNKAITEIENFFDWIVILRVETEVRAKKKVTSLPGAIAPIKMIVLTPNKV